MVALRTDSVQDLYLHLGENKIKDDPVIPFIQEERNRFPVDALPDDWDILIDDLCHAIQVSTSICAQSFLAVISFLAQAHINVEMDGRISPVSLYFATVAESGSRKSTIDGFLLQEIREWEKARHRKYEEEIAQWEMFQAETKKPLLKPLEPYVLINDPTYEGIIRSLDRGQPTMGLFTDEGGVFLGGHAMSKDNMLKTASGLSGLWDGKEITRARAGEGLIKIYGKRVALHLMIQPTMADRFLNNTTLKDQGLLSRFLTCRPSSIIGSRAYKSANPHEYRSFQYYKEVVQKILAIPFPLIPQTRNNIAPRTITLTKEAYQTAIKFFNRVETEQQKGKAYAEITGFASKALDNMLRIAGSLAFFEHPTLQSISEKYIISASQIMDYYLAETSGIIPELRPQYLSMKMNDKLAEELMEWIKKHIEAKEVKQITKRDITRLSPYKFQRSKELREHCLSILVDHEFLMTKDNGLSYQVNVSF